MMSPKLPVLARNLPLRLSVKGVNPVHYSKKKELVVSGFEWPDNTKRTYSGQAYATVDKVGKGSIILLAEDPVFRVTYTATAKLLTNAIFLGSTLN